MVTGVIRLSHQHNYKYTSEIQRTGSFDINIESLYFLELSCECGDTVYEQYHFEDTVTMGELKSMGYEE